MKSLDEWNVEAAARYRTVNYRANGIACPCCGTEMVDADDMILTSDPPQRNVVCPGCDFKGYRIA